MKRFAIIVAGGSGSRMGGGMPKQFRALNGRPVLWWSMKAFHDENPETRLVVVLPREFVTLWNDLFSSLPENVLSVVYVTNPHINRVSLLHMLSSHCRLWWLFCLL